MFSSCEIFARSTRARPRDQGPYCDGHSTCQSTHRDCEEVGGAEPLVSWRGLRRHRTLDPDTGKPAGRCDLSLAAGALRAKMLAQLLDPLCREHSRGQRQLRSTGEDGHAARSTTRSTPAWGGEEMVLTVASTRSRSTAAAVDPAWRSWRAASFSEHTESTGAGHRSAMAGLDVSYEPRTPYRAQIDDTEPSDHDDADVDHFDRRGIFPLSGSI